MGAEFVTFDNAVNAMPLLCRVLYEGAAYLAVLKNLLCLFYYLRIIRRVDYRAEITVTKLPSWVLCSLLLLTKTIRCASKWFILTQRPQNLEFVNLKCVTYTQLIQLSLQAYAQISYGGRSLKCENLNFLFNAFICNSSPRNTFPQRINNFSVKKKKAIFT